MEGLTSLKAVPCCGRDDAYSGGTAPLTELMLGAVGTSAGVAIEVWTARR